MTDNENFIPPFGNYADLLSQCHQFHIAKIVSINEYRAFANIVKAWDEIYQRCLS